MTGDWSAPWRKRAACLGSDPMFDDHIGVEESSRARKARFIEADRICVRCPVRADCLADVDLLLDDGFRAGHVIEQGRLVPLAEWLHRPRPPAGVLLPREHGTARGYRQHNSRDDMPACEPCLEANRVENRAEWARRVKSS